MTSSFVRSAAGAVAFTASVASAQPAPPPPRFGALFGFGVASTPDIGQPRVTSESLSALLASAALRLRPARHLFVDAAAQFQTTVGTREDRTTQAPPAVSRWWAANVRDRGVLASSEVRVGAETSPSGRQAATAHAAVGGGYLWGVAAPFASLSGGVATGLGASPGGLRLTADLEYRRFRLSSVDMAFDYATWRYREPTTNNPGSERRDILLVRLGVEVPLGR